MNRPHFLNSFELELEIDKSVNNNKIELKYFTKQATEVHKFITNDETVSRTSVH